MAFTISVGKLRQNPTEAFEQVEAGHDVIVTRNNREVAKLTPVVERRPVTAQMAEDVYRRTPLPDNSWAAEVDAAREEEWANPWERQ